MIHVPLRRCRVCRQQRPKADLERWTIQDGVITKDENKMRPGRGYYGCPGRCSEILPKTIKSPRKDKQDG
jgi:predicted RNA-binding protein YlxR (DUF448 family)